MDKINVELEELIICMSKAQDIMSDILSNHHQRVAYLSFRLAQEIGLSHDEQKEVYLAALVHDIGALTINEKIELIDNDPIDIHKHARKGAKLLEGFQPLSKISKIIEFHHVPWSNGEGLHFNGDEVPYSSHIIHLADRVCSIMQQKKNVISQLPEILKSIDKRVNTYFVPDLVEALHKISKIEFIWFDLTSDFPVKRIRDEKLLTAVKLEVDDILDFALIFSYIIDFRSSFTARHSAGVAKTAAKLASLIGFSEFECKMMLIAGYLHDLGKLAISNDILEKPDRLTENEFNEIRKHTYLTYILLEPIEAFSTINQWASYHHERLDGSGYPFHIEGANLTLGSRILAVADVFTAITEDRPYRKSMDDESAKSVINDMVEANALDDKVVSVLLDNFKTIQEIRENAQKDAMQRYESFLQI